MTNVDPTVIKRIEDKVLNVLLLAQNIYGQPFRLPTLEYRQMGRRAGTANYSEWTLTLNPDYLRNGHLEDMIEQTLPHELAHFVSYTVYGPLHGRGHGREWKSVMSRLGLQVKRCHNYSMEGVKTRTKAKISAKCPSCDKVFNITTYRANQIQQGINIFHTAPGCRWVKETLILV
jgi:SprT protein